VKRLGIFISAVLLTGCALGGERPTRAAATPLSATDRERVAGALRQAPAALRRALYAEAQARPDRPLSAASDGSVQLPPGGRAQPAAGSSEAGVSELTLPGIIGDLLLNTQTPLLLPDAGFTAVNGMSGKRRQPPAAPFSAALTGYLTTPAFQCRQPMAFRYFQERYPGQKGTLPCGEAVPFFVITRYEGAQPVWVDPKRVSSIHILFAGEGEGMVSRFGHVALRLVVCPEGETDKALCDANLPEHLVLGFGAHVNDLELDLLKALQGGYQAYLFASRFMDVYQDYAIGEFREMYSLPLVLDREPREQMVRELSEIHWRYSDDYGFFSRNCTSLLQQALRVLSPPFAKSGEMASDYIRPDVFFAALKNSSLVEGNKLSSLEVAEQQGYFFSSTKPLYQRAAATIRGSMSAPGFEDLESYLQVNPLIRRRAMAQDQRLSLRLGREHHLLDAQLMLEELALTRSEVRLMAAAAGYFHDLSPSKLDSIRRQLNAEQLQAFNDCLMQPTSLITKPFPRLSAIPDRTGIPAAAKVSPTCLTADGLSHLKEAIASINATDPAHWREIDEAARYWAETINNITYLKAHFDAGQGSIGDPAK
jgi:hypothetical protein